MSILLSIFLSNWWVVADQLAKEKRNVLEEWSGCINLDGRTVSFDRGVNARTFCEPVP